KLVKSLSTWCSSRSARSWASTRSERWRPTAHRGSRGSCCWPIVFVLPYALLMAEVGRAFTPGGRALRVDEARLRPSAGRHRRGPLLGHQPAVGGRVAGLHRHRGVEREPVQHRLRLRRRLHLQGLFIWLSIGVAIVSLRHGKWIPNVGAFLRVFVLGVF